MSVARMVSAPRWIPWTSNGKRALPFNRPPHFVGGTIRTLTLLVRRELLGGICQSTLRAYARSQNDALVGDGDDIETASELNQ
jgi:hypothetical protein